MRHIIRIIGKIVFLIALGAFLYAGLQDNIPAVTAAAGWMLGGLAVYCIGRYPVQKEDE